MTRVKWPIHFLQSSYRSMKWKRDGEGIEEKERGDKRFRNVTFRLIISNGGYSSVQHAGIWSLSFAIYSWSIFPVYTTARSLIKTKTFINVASALRDFPHKIIKPLSITSSPISWSTASATIATQIQSQFLFSNNIESAATKISQRLLLIMRQQ